MSVRPFRSVRIVLVFGLLVVSCLSGTAAFEAPVEEHCVANVVSQMPDGELILGEPRCYPSFAEAMFDASGGALTLDADATGSVLWTDPGAGVLASTFTLGTHFDGYGGAGSSISVVGSGCTGGWWNTSVSWSNRISSSWNGCYRLKHHDLPNRGGTVASTIGAGSTHNVPSFMDNKTESVSYWSS